MPRLQLATKNTKTIDFKPDAHYSLYSIQRLKNPLNNTAYDAYIVKIREIFKEGSRIHVRTHHLETPIRSGDEISTQLFKPYIIKEHMEYFNNFFYFLIEVCKISMQQNNYGFHIFKFNY